MIKEARISYPTGVMYAQEYPSNALSNALARTINVQDPAFLYARTDQVTGYVSQESTEISSSLLQYRFLSMTTGCELHGVDMVVVVERISENITTNFLVTFEYKSWMRTGFDPDSGQLSSFNNASPASVQAERLREISGLTIKRIAEIFGVSLTTYHKWISGFSLRDAHRTHLFEVLSLMEQAAQRLGSPHATSTWLLTPVSPGGKKPIEYLSSRQYTTFRGFLLYGHSSEELFRPPTPLKYPYQERPREEIEDELVRLNPGARFEEDTSEVDK